MLEALSDFFDVESDWLCGKGENVRWCNELFLPTVTDTDCSNVQGKEDAAEVFAKNIYYRVALGALGGCLLCKSAFAIKVGVGATGY